MVKIGNFFFTTRNYLFPVFYIILFLPFPRISENYILVFGIGLLITLIGQGVRMATIGLVYIIRGGKDHKVYAEGLVTGGLFSHCRNPMYVGNVLMVIGMSILSNSIFSVLVMIPFFIFIYEAIIRAEENFLRTKFGPGFDEYCSHVNRWIPRFNGLAKTFREGDFNPLKVVFMEYNTTFIWMLGAILILGYNYFWITGLTVSTTTAMPFIIALAVLTFTYLTMKVLNKTKVINV